MTAKDKSSSQPPSASPPKAFISYSRSSPDYVERVVGLADRLVGDGVEIVLDIWGDLSDGQDLHAFMERSVNDPTISHVLILCDPMYAEKANNREKGVGKETLIISPSVYKDVKQKRVVPVIMERDANGQVLVPTYLDGRHFVDLSIPDSEAQGYEQLLRTLHGKPARKRPPLGKPPSFLEEGRISLRTSGVVLLLRSAVLQNRPQAVGLLADYLDRLFDVYAEEQIKDPPTSEDELIKAALGSIERFRPYRDEFIETCKALARYVPDATFAGRLHGFFERLASVRRMHRQVRWSENAETENLGFIAWELYLYALAVFLREPAFSAAAKLLAPMVVRSYSNPAGVLVSPDVLQPGFPLLQRWNDLEQLNKVEAAAHLARERNPGTGVPFEAIMEADLLLWYRVKIAKEYEGRWYPHTLAYLGYTQRLPLFERARAAEFFARAGPVLGVLDREAFVRRFREIQDDWSFYSVGHSIGGRESYARQLGIDPSQ